MQTFGPESRDRYWEIFEGLRVEPGYADYLGALQRYRLGALNDPRLLQMSAFLVDYPPADLAIERIRDLLDCDVPALLERGRAGNQETTTNATQ